MFRYHSTRTREQKSPPAEPHMGGSIDTTGCPVGIINDAAITTSVPCSPRHNTLHLGFGEPEPCSPSRDATRMPGVGFWRRHFRLSQAILFLHGRIIRSCVHHMLMTVTKLRTSIERCDATCCIVNFPASYNGTAHASLLGIPSQCSKHQTDIICS
jgi:hypothetical protein